MKNKTMIELFENMNKMNKAIGSFLIEMSSGVPKIQAEKREFSKDKLDLEYFPEKKEVFYEENEETTFETYFLKGTKIKILVHETLHQCSECNDYYKEEDLNKDLYCEGCVENLKETEQMQKDIRETDI